VIRSFRHRGLKDLYESRTTKRVAPAHLQKLRDILAVLDRSGGPEDMALPGFRSRPLKDGLAGHWAESVSGNWSVTFRFLEGHAVDGNYLDYH
jgi:proteic killer suppression protein